MGTRDQTKVNHMQGINALPAALSFYLSGQECAEKTESLKTSVHLVALLRKWEGSTNLSPLPSTLTYRPDWLALLHLL